MKHTPRLLASVAAIGLAGSAFADQVILDDLIVDGSACIGLDCVNGENFGFDTIRLKENNLRIKFDDTSTTASFPSTDWQLTANDSSNGGQNRFSIEDVTTGRVPFTVEGNAPTNALFVEDTGDIGIGTNSPAVDVHAVDGDSPTLRLEQNGSSGFSPQTWDLAGNETNFFVRDVTNGSLLPFRIRPGAPTNSVYVDADGDIGMGTASPDSPLHLVTGEVTNGLLVDATDGGASGAFAHFRTAEDVGSIPTVLIEDNSATAASRRLLELRNNGGTSITLQNDNSNVRWVIVNENSASDSRFILNNPAANGTSNELVLDNSGNLTVFGTITSGSTQLNVPDYVFEDNYELLALSEVKAFIDEHGHLPNVPSAAEIAAEGTLDMSRMQMKLLEKVEELTLYTLEQDQLIQEMSERLKELEG